MPYNPYDPKKRRVVPAGIDAGSVRERYPDDVQLAAMWGSRDPVAPPPESNRAYPPPAGKTFFRPKRTP